MSYVETAEHAARAAAEVLLTHFRQIDLSDARTKSTNDFVSHVDNESERVIRDIILNAYPDHRFLGEEEGMSGTGDEWCWIVDPLDGTSNYVHGVPQFSVSIALQHRGEPVAAIVYDPLRDDLHAAEKASGTYLNGEPASIAHDQPMADALIGTGFPFRHHKVLDDYVATFAAVFPKVSGIRRPGSAAIDFAWVACGFTAGFWEFLLSPWDVAAGALLITEAGGIITDFAGGDGFLKSGNVVAGSPNVHAELLDTVQRELIARGFTLA